MTTEDMLKITTEDLVKQLNTNQWAHLEVTDYGSIDQWIHLAKNIVNGVHQIKRSQLVVDRIRVILVHEDLCTDEWFINTVGYVNTQQVTQ